MTAEIVMLTSVPPSGCPSVGIPKASRRVEPAVNPTARVHPRVWARSRHHPGRIPPNARTGGYLTCPSRRPVNHAGQVVQEAVIRESGR